MRVGLNLQPSMGNRTGIGMFTHEVAKRLKNDENLEFQGEVFDFRNRNKSENLRNEYDFPIQIYNKIPFGIYRRIWNVVPLNYEMFFQETDIHHFFNYIVPPKVSGKVITTIYDLTYLRYPETMTGRSYDYLKQGMDYSIARSDVIITDSDFIKEELIQLLHVPEKKIQTVHLAPSIQEVEEPIDVLRSKYSMSEQPFFLYLGSIEPRKNLVRVIQAYNQVRKESHIEYQLVLAGGKGWNNQDIYREAECSPFCKDIIFTDYITDAEKTTLYKHATLFLFPSLYEGFGIPILEAMYYQIPVITSNVSSMPEVAGEAAELVNPLEVESITSGMKRILNNPVYRDKLVEKGTERVLDFDWNYSVEKIRKIYSELL